MKYAVLETNHRPPPPLPLLLFFLLSFFRPFFLFFFSFFSFFYPSFFYSLSTLSFIPNLHSLISSTTPPSLLQLSLPQLPMHHYASWHMILWLCIQLTWHWHIKYLVLIHLTWYSDTWPDTIASDTCIIMSIYDYHFYGDDLIILLLSSCTYEPLYTRTPEIGRLLILFYYWSS